MALFLQDIYPEKAFSHYFYSVVHVENSFIYFGGQESTGKSLIAKFAAITRHWSNIGNLVTGRDFQGAIFDGTHFLVAGGLGSLKTELCSLADSTMTCHQQQPELTNYYNYPELFLVEDDYCKKT